MRAVVGGENGGKALQADEIPLLEDMPTIHQPDVTASPAASTSPPPRSLARPPPTSRSRRPAGHLTLHAYRRQQATPSPPPVEHGRRIKRRPAASQLKQGDCAPAPHARSCPSLHQVTRSEELLKQPGLSFAPPHLPSFQSLPTSLPDPPLTAEPTPPPSRDASASVNNTSLATANAASTAKLTSRTRDLGRLFKPIKRLPRHSDAELRPWAYSPLRMEDPSSGRSSSTGHTLTSTLTLSKFPFPKPPQSQPLLVDKSESSNSRSQPHVAHLADTPPPTPATLHYRGTAFDVVNPHQSLYFSNIETPADRDTEIEDYFLRESSRERSGADEMASDSRFDDDTRSMSAHGKQHRALFDDLRSAHASIARSKTVALHPDTTPSAADFPMPPMPAVLNSARHHKFESFEEPITSPAPLSIKKTAPARPLSFMQRVSSALGFDKTQKSTPDMSMKNMADLDPTHNRVSVVGSSRSKGNSAPVFGLEEEREIERARALKRVSMSESALPDDGYYDYDVESIYGTSDGHDSASLYRGSGPNRGSVPYGVREQVTDYSSETDVNSYSYEFGGSQRSSMASPPYSQRRSRGPFLQHGNSITQLSHHGSTIGSIINDYGYSHSGDISEASLEDFIESDDDVAHISNLQQEDIALEMIRKEAGLSQFDFNIHQQASASSSPETPEFGMSPEIPSSRYAQAGSPPHTPLPTTPPANAHRPYPPLARYNSGVSSEFMSRVSSYGDTRKLLLISGGLQSPSQGRISVKDEDLVPGERGSVPSVPTRIPPPIPTRNPDREGSRIQLDAPPQAKLREGPSRRAICYSNQRALPASSSRPIIPTLGYAKPDGPSLDNFKSAEYPARDDRSQIPMIWRKTSPGPQTSLAPPPVEPRNRRSFSTVSSLDCQACDENRASSSAVSSVGDWETIPAHNEANCRNQAHDHARGLAPDVSPSSDFQGGTGFPHLNVLAPKPDTGITYERPGPLTSNHVNPFSSSPPPMTPESVHSPQSSRFSNSYVGRLRSRGGTNSRTSFASRGVPNEYMEDIPLTDLQFTAEQTEALLNSGPNESIIVETPRRQESGQVLYRQESRRSKGWKPLPLRVGEHVAGRSPDTDRDNSFSKLTVLGPQVNLTGTPNGTGMRNAGSSVVNSSAARPVVAYDPTLDNSSMPAYYSSPLNRMSMGQSSLAYSGRGSIPSMGPTDSQTNILRGRRMGSPLTKLNTNDSMPGPSNPSSPPIHTKRTSVRSQKELRPIRLGRSQDDIAQGKDVQYISKKDISECAFRRPPGRQFSNETILYDVDARSSHEHSWTWECIPHLERAMTQPAAVPRQNKLSWGILALVSCFPPLLLLYSMGRLDWVMVWWSGGQIDHFGRRQRVLAMVLAIASTIVLPSVAIVLILLVKFGKL